LQAIVILIQVAIMMSANHIRTVVESFYADIWNRHDKSKIPALLCSDFTFRGSLGQARTGHDGFASYVDFVHKALAEYRCDILDLVVEEPKAFARMRFSGIHRGDFFGYPPTGKPVEWAGSALFTFSVDQVADLWVLGDVHGLLQLLDRNAHG
jgi:predicted ester cyclase